MNREKWNQLPKNLLPLALFALFFLPSVLQNLERTNETIDLFNSPDTYLFTLFGNSIITLTTLLALFKVQKIPLKDSGLRIPSYRAILSIPLYLFTLFIGSILISLVVAQFFPEHLNQNKVPFHTPKLIPLLLLTMLSVGYTEELFFRGYLLFSFEKWMPPILATLLSAILFSLGHAYQGLAAIPGTFLLGILLTGIRKHSDSLHIVAITHGLYNFLLVLHPLLFIQD